MAQALRENLVEGGVFDRRSFESSETTIDGSWSVDGANPGKSERGRP